MAIRAARKMKFGVRFTEEVRAYTWRRTPKDVEGANWAVSCVVLGTQRSHGVRKGRVTPIQVKTKWLWVRFEDGTTALRHNDNTYVFAADASGKCEGKKVPILTALAKTDREGRWWQSARGTLERPATIYEATRHYKSAHETHVGEVPSPGWTLVNGFERARELKAAMPIEPELDEAARVAREAAKRLKLERGLANAAVNVKRYERRQKLATTLLAKWMRKVKDYERRLEVKAKGDSDE